MTLDQPINIGLRIVTDASASVERAPRPEPAPAPSLAVVHGEDGEHDTPPPGASVSDWKSYAAWRRTKCPSETARYSDNMEPKDAILMLLNATLGLCGEAGEMVELWARHESACLVVPAVRSKLIREIGDILFYAVWCIDALTADNPLVLADPTYPDRPFALLPDEDIREEAMAGRAILAMGENSFNPATAAVAEHAAKLAAMVGAEAGLFADCVKKLVFHAKPPANRGDMVERVLSAIMLCERMLAMLGTGLEEAALVNVQKLDSRYPHGFVRGGGDRAGKGE